MFINLLKAKIHQASVSEANLNYIVSITIDKEILQQVGLQVNELVHVVNINNGSRIETYIIEGNAGERQFCLNGAAARHFYPGDKIIVMAYCWLDEQEAKTHQPKIVFMNNHNHIQQIQSGENERTYYKSE